MFKQLLKSTGLVALGLAMFGGLVAPVAQAELKPVFNHMADDFEFMQGRISPNGVWSDPVENVKATDEVDVVIFYHNGIPDSTATNVRLKVTLPTTFATSHVLRGELSADNADTITGTVHNGVEIGKPNLTINTTSSTKVHFVPGSVRWYPERSTPNGAGATLPNGQNANNLVTTGINLGDVEGCWDHSGFVVFKVKFEGETVEAKKAILKLNKLVRQANTDNTFVDRTTITPGQVAEYRVTVRNIDGEGIATSVKLIDRLPAGLTYVAGSTKLQRGTAVTELPDGITSVNGLIVVPDLKPQEEIVVTYRASSNAAQSTSVCLPNTVSVQAVNAQLPGEEVANVCLTVASPTPTPTATQTTPATHKPTPKPELPKTGSGLDVMAVLGMSGAAGTAGRYLMLKRQVRNAARKVNVL